MPISAVGRTSLVEAVVLQLREQIETESLRPGARLPTEAELTSQLQVSRNVLREAIGRLETLGLVTVRRGQGMFVAEPDKLVACARLVRSAAAISPRDLVEFTEFRAAVEVHVAEAAARCATPEQVAQLAAICDEMDRKGQSYKAAIERDFSFHRALIEITGNQLALNIMTVLHEFFLAAMSQTTPRPRDHAVSQRLHRAIVQAIGIGDAEGARRAMQEHMRVTLERVTRSDSQNRDK
ncbi:MAG: FadR/GntR family transcriptional regulator [Planctomycetota bacterium]